MIYCKLVFFSIICVLVKSTNILNKPDYVPRLFHSSDNKNNLRRTFQEKKLQKIVADTRVEIIDKYILNSSVFVDGILHEKIDKNHKQLSLVNLIEKSFRALIGMDGVSYYYKRDSYWRTWRKVSYPDGDKMVCYRCESAPNCTDCQDLGHWAIDENPPCPYEIVSLITKADACAINFKNSTNTEEPCPTVAKFTDIMIYCDNPIYTQWRIQKVYKKEVSERYPSIFCEGRDYCSISTIYLITPDYVLFRIVNSTNHITYSKIMKINGVDYACVADCGVIDPNTKTFSKTDQPLKVDLINNKNKREDKPSTHDLSPITNGSTVSNKTTPTNGDQKSKPDRFKVNINGLEIAFNFPMKVNDGDENDDDEDDHRHHHHDEKHPTCSSMKRRMERMYESDEMKPY